MNKSMAILVAAAFFTSSAAYSGDYPVFTNNGVLMIPSVSTDDQVGRFQDVAIQANAQGQWQLTDVRVLRGDPSLYRAVYLAPVSGVALIQTTEMPAQVFLQVSGAFGSGCGRPGRISQRLVGNRFEVLLADEFTSYDVANCTAIMTSYVKTIPLPVYGLSAGSYSYDVNGVTGSFALPDTNEIPGDCIGNCQK